MSGTFYSQSFEDKTIKEFFGDFKGNLLSIGENNGVHLSNCLALIESGFLGVLVEPSEISFKELTERHKLNKNVTCINVALMDYVGVSDFYESGEHLGKGDHSLLSTLNESELKRWEGTNNEFTKTKCIVWDFKTLQEQLEVIKVNNKYDFISIDAEGNDCMILKQMDLKELGCRCLIIEHNGMSAAITEIKEYCNQFGLTKQLLINAENIILTHE